MEESEHMVAQVRGWGHLQYREDGEAVQDANAALIASAPDMAAELARLRARVKRLEEALKVIKDFETDYEDAAVFWHNRACETARAALEASDD